MKGRPSTKQSRLTARRKRRQLNTVVDKLVTQAQTHYPDDTQSFAELAEVLAHNLRPW